MNHDEDQHRRTHLRHLLQRCRRVQCTTRAGIFFTASEDERDLLRALAEATRRTHSAILRHALLEAAEAVVNETS